jgi:hypothetical protein
LTVEPGGTTLDQRYIGRQAHFVDMSARTNIVQSTEDHIEPLKPLDVELGIHNVCVVRNDLDIGIESLGYVLGNQSFGLLDVFSSEKKLSIEIAQVDRVEVEDMNLAKAGKGKVLEQFAADAACANHQNSTLCWTCLLVSTAVALTN